DLQRRARHLRCALSGRPGLSELAGDMLQRAHDLADRLGGNARIERRRVKLGMTEQDLDHTNIDVLFQKMGGKAVPQRVQGDTLLDVGDMDRGMAGAVELARRHRLHRIAARKQPTLWTCCLPPDAQKREQMRRQHHIAILAALALLDADQHALAVMSEILSETTSEARR